jgi:hypothetical protein
MGVIPGNILDIEVLIENFDTVDRIRIRFGIISAGGHDGYMIRYVLAYVVEKSWDNQRLILW